jgi:acetyl-CoA carboxylase biotin carboxyl carrier protein
MDYKAIQELIDTMNKSELYSLEIQSGDMNIKMKKGPDQIISPIAQESFQASEKDAAAKPAAAETETAAPEKLEETKPEDGFIVTSPIVGTFYESSSPDTDPFVKVGSKVKKGEVLCIIEAMKLMNEIESEVDGEVVEVLAESQQMVQFGQPLYRIKTK